MPRFTLKSQAKPKISGGQQTLLYEVMQALRGSAMFDEIAAKCNELGYGERITAPVTIHASVMVHLHDWESRNPPIVTVEY
jgi:hypothetical protein